MNEFFSKIAHWVSAAAGSWQASVIAAGIILAWIGGGFYFGFSNQLYQLFINSLTTVITFLMVFLIQNAQNKHAESLQIKLNEIICALDKADNKLIDIEEVSEEELKAARKMVDDKKDQGKPI